VCNVWWVVLTHSSQNKASPILCVCICLYILLYHTNTLIRHTHVHSHGLRNFDRFTHAYAYTPVHTHTYQGRKWLCSCIWEVQGFCGWNMGKGGPNQQYQRPLRRERMRTSNASPVCACVWVWAWEIYYTCVHHLYTLIQTRICTETRTHVLMQTSPHTHVIITEQDTHTYTLLPVFRHRWQWRTLCSRQASGQWPWTREKAPPGDPRHGLAPAEAPERESLFTHIHV
jgi:hypothetical protein